MTEFLPFPKIARLNREVIVTEKIDGTNACVHIGDDGTFLAGSRSRWITPDDDNFGFARWAHDHREELMSLGPGTHYGEWWGSGIQRDYGLQKGEKRFSLFNVSRWHDSLRKPDTSPRPACCHVVPLLGHGLGLEVGPLVESVLELLRSEGSFASPGFMKPEGVVVFHTAAQHLYKVTLERDEEPKGKRSA
jgi:hypothetical protein